MAADDAGNLGGRLLAAAMALPLAMPAQAESAPEHGLVAFKLLDYRESQPGADRVRVKAPSLLVQAPISGEWSVGGSLISDAISGASPAYHSSGLTPLRDHRHAVEANVTRWFPNGSLTVGANFSSEADYVSRGVSMLATRSSDDKNTTWSAGVGVNRDSINPSNQVVVRERKRVLDLLLGLTQVFTTHDIAQFNLGVSLGSGYFSDPYKVFDERPRTRNHTTLQARWNHHVEGTGSTLRVSWRWYADTYRIRSHTLGLEVVQPLPGGWTLTPALRLYTQSAARFYVDAGPIDSPFVPNPPEGALSYTEDQRMSAFGARTLGLKIAKQLDADWLVDVKFERYGQRAGWRLFGTGSPDLLPFNARSLQIGLSRRF